MFGPRLGQIARAVPMMMAALSTYHAKIAQVVVVGPRAHAGTVALVREVGQKYQPFIVVVPVEPGARQDELARVLPFIAEMKMRDGRPTAYVCRDFACDEPATEASALGARIADLG